MIGTRTLLIVVVVLLACAAFWLAPSEPNDAPRPSLTPSTTHDDPAMDLRGRVSTDDGRALVPPSDTPADDETPSSDARPGADLDGPPAGHARVDVRVVTAAGRTPVSGVVVELGLVPRAKSAGEAPQARTDVSGLAHIDVPAPARLARVVVSSGRATGGALVERTFTLREGDIRTLDVTVPTCAGVAGLVLDAFGNPVLDAHVLAWSRSLSQLPADAERTLAPDAEASSDGAGRFELSCVGPQFVLTAVAPGLLCSVRLHGTLEPGERLTDLRILMTGSVSLDGRVTRDDGRAARGVRVLARGREPYRPEFLTERPTLFTCDAADVSTLTDEQGRFHFEALAPRALTFSVDVPDAPPLHVTHDPRDGELLLVLSTGCTVAGVVRDTDEHPIADALVRVEGDDLPRRSARSDAAGRYRVSGLAPDDEARVLALADGHAPTVVQPVAVVPGRETWVELRLEAALSITGRLLDAQRQPIVGASLVLEGERLIASAHSRYPLPTWERAWGLESAYTDDDGRFTFTQLHVGGYRLEALHPHDPTLRRTFAVAAGEHDLELVLDPLALSDVTLEGDVRDALTGLPVTRFDVTPHRHLPDDTFSGEPVRVDDTRGHFLLTGVAPGELIVMVTAPGYRPWIRPLTEYADGQHAFDVALVPNRSLALRVVDEHGAPVRRASVRCTDDEGSILWIQFGAGASATSLRTDDQGEVDVHGLPAATVTVRAERDDAGRRREGRAVFDLRSPVTDRRILVVSPPDD